MQPLTHAWNEAITDYLMAQRSAHAPVTTINSRRQHLSNLAREIALEPWEISADQLVAWFGARTWSRETRRGRRTTFRSFWGWAVAADRTTSNPALALPIVKPAHPSPRPTPERVYTAALAAARPRVALMLRLAAECGLRRAEVAALHTDDVTEDLIGYTLRILGKGDKVREVPCPPGLAQHLLAGPRGFIFPGDMDGHLSPRYVGKLVAAVMPEHWTMHTLRHRAGTRWYQVDRDVFTVQDLLGHSSPATTRVYVQVPREALRRTVLAAAG